MTVTGYATISSNVLNGLSENGHECFCQAHNYVGQNLPPGLKFEDGRELKFTIMGTGKEPYSKDLWVPRIRELKPDIFAVLLDTFMLYPSYLQTDFAPAKTLFYFPSDGGKFPLKCEEILKKCQYPVAMSKYGQRQLIEEYGIKTDYIPHAVDTKNYFPLPIEERKKLRQKWGIDDKFVVGCVYRNQGRKMSDRQLKAFAKFAKINQDAVFFLHTDPYDVAAVFDTIELVKELGLENRVIFSGMFFNKGFTYKEMNDIYNLMDVYFMSTSGEGFGIPIIEASACGIPTAITDCTTTHELLIEDGVCGIPIKVITDMVGNWNVDRFLMDIDHGAKVLQQLHDDHQLRKTLGEVGREKILKYYSWDVVNKQWDKLIRKIEND